ncbi:MAG: FG-GAP-like repeat-containing protein [Pirellulaceae bacterium]
MYRSENGGTSSVVHEIQTQRSTALSIDLDQDSFQDIVLLQKDRVMVAYGEGAGSFSEVQTLFQVNETFDLSQVIDSTFLDMDYDGDLDLLLFNEQIYYENVDVWSKPAVRHELRFSSPDFNPPDAAKVVIPDTTPEHVRFLAYGDSLAVDLRIEPTYRRLDFNRDGMLDSKDIDRLHAQVASPGSGHRRDMRFDMNHDFFVDQADMARLLDQFGTSYGDVNVDGAFNSDDLVQVFQLGKFRDPGSQGTTAYSQGDWNLDGQFDSDDLVYAFQLGNYVVRGSFNSIPIESRSWTFAELAEVADRKNRTST